MNHVAKKALKVTGSIVFLLVLAVAAGIGYTWYMSEYGNEENQAIQHPTKASGGLQTSKRPKIPDTATLGVSVQSITSPVVPGSNASLTVKTNPEANCSIEVAYNDVPVKDSGLVTKKADEYGIVEWTWTVPGNAPVGNWPVKATCANKKNTAVVENDLRIVKRLE